MKNIQKQHIDDANGNIYQLQYFTSRLIASEIAFIIAVDNNKSYYYINKLVKLITGVSLSELSINHYSHYLLHCNGINNNKLITSNITNMSIEIDNIVEWYKNIYLEEEYKKIKKLIINSSGKINIEILSNIIELHTKLLNFPRIKIWAKYIKNIIPIIKYILTSKIIKGNSRRTTTYTNPPYPNNILGQYYTSRHIQGSIGRKFDIVISNPPYSNNKLGQYYTSRHIMSN
jgi:hypothetical protein